MEINEKNILEQTKGEIHQEDSEHFENREESSQQIHKDDTHQIKLLSDKVDSLTRKSDIQTKKLDNHCRQNETSEKMRKLEDRDTAKKIDSIIDEQKRTAWLADNDIKETMKMIVKDKQFQNEAVQRAIKFGGVLLKIVLIIGAILTAIWTTLKLMGKNV